MSIPSGAVEQVRSLLRSGDLNRQQLAELKRLGRLAGPDPDPSGYRSGEPFWTSQKVIAWSETAKRTRADLPASSVRSLLGGLLDREAARTEASQQSIDELAVDIVLGDVTSDDDIEARCVAAGISPSALEQIVTTVSRRKEVLDKSADVEQAKAETTELEAEIVEINAEIEARTQGLRDRRRAAESKIEKLKPRTRDNVTAGRDMMESAPPWLNAAADQAKANRIALERRRRQRDFASDRLSQQIEAAKAELAKIPGRLNLFVSAAVGDYEANQEAKRLRARKTDLEATLAELKAQHRTTEADAKQIARDLAQAHARENRVFELKTTHLWPQPADLEGEQ